MQTLKMPEESSSCVFMSKMLIASLFKMHRSS